MNIFTEMLKSKAINLNTLILMEDNKTSGCNIDLKYKYIKKFYRITKILKDRYNIIVDVDSYDNLIFLDINNKNGLI